MAVAIRAGMRIHFGDLACHGARIGAFACALAAVPPALTPLAAAGLFLAIFAIAHDIMHGALQLPRRLNELALTAAGLAVFASGHGLRLSHLRHHASTLGRDDVEGAAAHLSLARACAAAPRLFVALRVAPFVAASRRQRRWQIAEHAASAIALAAALAGPRPLVVYALVVIAAQVSAPVWAGLIPHRPPPWLLRAARALAFTRSPTVLSLAFHELHHARPKVPCQSLGYYASPVRLP